MPGASSESYRNPVAVDSPCDIFCHASQSCSASESSPGACAFEIASTRVDPSRDFAAFLAITWLIACPSLFFNQWCVSFFNTNVGRPPSSARGELVTASIRRRPWSA